MQTKSSGVQEEIFVDEYTGGLVGPSLGFAGTVKDGGYIRCVVPPSCWGADDYARFSRRLFDCFLGGQERDMADFERDEIHHRHFYHLRYNGPLVAMWRHQELHPADDPEARPIFEFFWASLPDAVPPLIADHGIMLPALLKKLELDDR